MKKRNGKDRPAALANLLYMMGYAARYVPGYFAALIARTALNALWTVFASTLFLKMLFDAIEGDTDFPRIFTAVMAVAVLRIALIIFDQWVLDLCRRGAELTLHERMQGELYEKALRLDFGLYDSPEFYDNFIWTIRESDARVMSMLDACSGFLSSLISAAGILAVFLSIDVFAALTVLAVGIANYFLNKKLNRLRYEKAMARNNITRRKEYAGRIFGRMEYAKEMRIGGIAGLLQENYRKAADDDIACLKKYAPRILLGQIVSSILVSCVFQIVITGYMIIRYAIDPSLSLGDFAVGVNAIWKLFLQVNSLIMGVTGLQEHSMYIEKFRTFLDAKTENDEGTLGMEPFKSLEISDVGFAYRGSGQDVLSGVSIKVGKGEKVAIVGANGAGKTTLARLLLRLYEPQRGSIRYNGREISEYRLAEYRSRIGAVFQDFKLFAATLAENVSNGEHDPARDGHIREALRQMLFDDRLESMRDGLDSVLTREFDENGVYLSGGESQKVAISRVLAGDFDLIIMDEPSAALDPAAEYELNHILAESEDRTILFISHRLSTTRMADRIYVLDGGRVAESGNHDELMQKNGIYAEMFRTQASKYCV